jgi:predicted nucleic acid-binding protein
VTVLVDSDIVIEVTRANRVILQSWFQLSQSEDIVLYSPVTEAELWAGARPHEHSALTLLFAKLVCVPIDRDVGRQAGEYLRQYHKSHGLQIADALIASGAVLNRAALWTRHRKHYPMKELSFYSA